MADAVDCMRIYGVNTRGRCEQVTYRANAEYAGADGGTASSIDLGQYDSPKWDTSTALADALGAQAVGRLYTTWPAPRNARVYWDGRPVGHPDGHVAISVGDGTVMSTDFPYGVISQQTVEYVTNATGYTLIGWSDQFGGHDVQHLGTTTSTPRRPPVITIEKDANSATWWAISLLTGKREAITDQGIVVLLQRVLDARADTSKGGGDHIILGSEIDAVLPIIQRLHAPLLAPANLIVAGAATSDGAFTATVKSA